MLDYTLSAEKLDKLPEAHRVARDKREADCIKAVLALATGWSAEDVAEILHVEANSVRNHFKRYRQGGIEALRAIGAGIGGSTCALSAEQLAILVAHLQENLYRSAKPIVHWVEETSGVSYTESGTTPCCIVSATYTRSPNWCPARRSARPKSSSSSMSTPEFRNYRLMKIQEM